MGIFDNLFGKRKSGRVHHTWENLPSCAMIILEDFDARQITEEALSASKEIICLIPAGGLADPTGFKQVEILCRFADEQDLAVLTWQSMVFVRRSFLAKVGLSSSTLSGVVSDLIKMAQQHCL